jgi:PAS domain S-box-containing protein
MEHRMQEYDALRRQYESLVNGSLAAVYRTTWEGRFIECNEAMARMLGYADRETLMAQPAASVYPDPEARDAFLRALEKEGRLLQHGISLRHRDGSVVHGVENAFLETVPDGERNILGILVDTTLMRRALDAEKAMMERYKGLVEHMHEGFMVIVEGVVRYANPAACAFAQEGLEGKPVDMIIHAEQRQAFSSALEACSIRFDGPVRVRFRRVPERELQGTMASIPFEGRTGVQLIIRDLTAQQQLSHERLRLQLAEEVNQVLRQEIIEHRRTQEELRRSRQFARNLIDSSLDMIMAADEDGRIIEYNPAASLRFGYEREEVLGKETTMLYADPSEHARVMAELEGHGAFAGEVRNVDKFGHTFTVFLTASRLFDESGRPIGAMGVSRDNTRLKRDQEALRASEERYRDLFENASDLIQSVAADGSFQYVNAAWCRTLGYSTAELERMSLWDIVHPEASAQLRSFFEGLTSGTGSGSVRTVFRAKDGHPVTVEGSTSVRFEDGRAVALRSILRDITAMLADRRQVQEHEAKLKALFESTEHLFWTAAPDLRLTSFNKGYERMIERLYGTKPEVNTDSSTPRRRFASEAYHGFWETKYAEAFAGKPIRFETDITDMRGLRVCNEIFLSPIFGPEGQVTSVFGIGHEITEKKVAEELVLEQGARLKAIFDSSANMMIWTLGRDLRLTSFNAQFQRAIYETHGIRFEMGDPFAERMAARVAPGQAEALLKRYHAALAGAPQQFEVELIDRAGKPAWVENFLNPIIVGGRVEEVSCLAYGITDRKEAHRELMVSLQEKEVLLKEVHHRVKNNLQVINSIMRLQGERVEDDRLKEILHHSRDRIRSMALIHDSLYQNKQFSSIDLGNYIDGLARNLVMSYSLSGRVALDLDLQPVHVSIDQAMPCGLILNELISNALKHGYPDQRPGTVRVALRLAGNRVEVAVADDGVGLAPGFVEERDGHLGLELVQMLVGQLDGRLRRTSPPGVAYLLTFEHIKQSGHGPDERPGGRG